MSTDHPRSGVSDLNEDTTSPQDSRLRPSASETPSVPAESISHARPIASVVPLDLAPSGDAAVANHPASGGESAAPVTATTSTTTIPANDTNTVAQSQKLRSPSMETEEPKTGAEIPSDQSDDALGKEAEDAGPTLHITLLLTTGSRHPFTIDGRYLRKRSVNVENHDPFAISVYTLKELIWREWRSGESFPKERGKGNRPREYRMRF